MLALLTLLAQDVVAGDDRGSAVRITVSGRIEFQYLVRSAAINEAGGFLNGAPGKADSIDAWSGRFTLRADAEVKDRVGGVIELENRSFDEGINLPAGSDPETDAVDVKQGYIDVPDFFLDGLRLRLGVQDIRFQNRPHDEAFFLDLGESEGWFAGYSAADARMTNSVDRDVLEAAGMSLLWTPYEVLGVHAFAVIYDENGASTDDEVVYGLIANARVAEKGALWVLALLVSGGQPDLGRIWTFGAGVDAYYGPLELFGEIYAQGGTLDSRVDKQAFAANGGVRAWLGPVWIEAAASLRSGDREAGDGRDEAFQSYENENRFLGLQSAEFGLDVDTNLVLLRLGVGAGPVLLDGRPLRFRVDVGRFEAQEPVVADETNWGIETDVTVSLDWNESLAFHMKFAWVGASDLFELFTPDGDDGGLLFLSGGDLRF